MEQWSKENYTRMDMLSQCFLLLYQAQTINDKVEQPHGPQQHLQLFTEIGRTMPLGNRAMVQGQ